MSFHKLAYTIVGNVQLFNALIIKFGSNTSDFWYDVSLSGMQIKCKGEDGGGGGSKRIPT